MINRYVFFEFYSYQFQAQEYEFIVFYENIKMDSYNTNIMVLPPEILVIIFKKLELKSINGIVSIKNTCTKWKNVIELMFNFKDKGMFHYETENKCQ